MSDKISVAAQISLEYWVGQDVAGVVYENMPVDPVYTNELALAIRSDDGDGDPRRPVTLGRPQVHLAGTSRALEELGRYLIGLARLQTLDPDVHDHFEDVQNEDGGTVHLVIRLVKPPG